MRIAVFAEETLAFSLSKVLDMIESFKGDVDEAMRASMGDETAQERLTALLRNLDQPLAEEGPLVLE